MIKVRSQAAFGEIRINLLELPSVDLLEGYNRAQDEELRRGHARLGMLFDAPVGRLRRITSYGRERLES